jgi:hypothetical protein
LEQAKAHAGNVDKGVVGRIVTACERIWGKFERSRKEDDAAVLI